MEQGTEAGGAEKDQNGDQKVPPGKGEDMANAGFESLQGKLTPFTLGLNPYYSRKHVKIPLRNVKAEKQERQTFSHPINRGLTDLVSS